MKLLLTALTLITLHSVPNPGLIDDPGARILIKNQLRDNKRDPNNYEIVYVSTDKIEDKEGNQGPAMNYYRITEKSSGRVLMGMVALYIGPIPTPTPTPSPLPTATPAGLKVEL